MLKTIRSSDVLRLEIENTNDKIVRFNISSGEELAKKE